MKKETELNTLIDRTQINRVRREGALVLDVDETILSRNNAGSAKQQTVLESASAVMLHEVLLCGFSVCIITGHGWKQLESRLIEPVLNRLTTAGNPASIHRLSVYANRGATKIIWDGTRYNVDKLYGGRYQLCENDVPALRNVLESLATDLSADVVARYEWYRRNFPGFDFDCEPASVSERDAAILVLRPIPGRLHVADTNSFVDLRSELLARGIDLLKRAKLSCEYELATAGRTSIEISRRGVSKELAVRDLLANLSKSTGKAVPIVERSLVYLGDEFYSGGNDLVIASRFPTALCLSVVNGGDYQLPANVVQVSRLLGEEGPAATARLLKHFMTLST